MPPEQQLIEPGPFEDQAAEAPAAEGAPEAPAAAAVAPAIYKGLQKDFSTLEELSEYTRSLERQTLEQQGRLSGMAAVPSTQAPAPLAAAAGLDYKKLGEEFILSPETAVEKIIGHVRSSVMGDVNQQVGRTEFYRAFYEVNEDLVGCEDLVEASVAKNSRAWANIPQVEAAKLLAHDVRQRAEKIRGGAMAPGATALPSRAPHALPSGGNPAPRSAAPAPAPKLTFAEQLKAAQAKHKKRA